MSVYKVYSGIPFKYRARKNKYWDKIGSGEITEDTAISVELENYAGLNITNPQKDIIEVAEGVLPDYNNFNGVKGVMKAPGKYLLEVDDSAVFATIGEPVIDNKTATGFSASNYLQQTVNLPEIFTFYTKFTISSSSSNQIVMSNQTKGSSFVRSDSLVLKAWSSSQNFGSFALTNGSTYWVKGVCDGVTYSLYGMLDTGQTLEEIKVSEDWVLSGSGTQSNFFVTGDNSIILGRNTSSYTSQFLTGTVYLNDTEFVDIWTPYGRAYKVLSGLFYDASMTDTGAAKTYNAIYKDDKFSLIDEEPNPLQMWVGSINVPEHIPSNARTVYFDVYGDVNIDSDLSYADAKFVNNSWIEIDKALPANEYNIECISRVTTSSAVNGNQNIFWDEVVDYGFGISNGKWRIWSGSQANGADVAINTSYWVKFVQTANSSTLYYAVDNGTYPEDNAWIQMITLSSPIFGINGDAMRLGNGRGSLTEPFYGLIHLKDTKININGEEYWKAGIFYKNELS